jgi:SAM-dependent methyltransferase
MTWDPVWEKIFKERAKWGKYPPEELVRFIAKNYYPSKDRRAIKILEIGCGPGAGPGWYIAREGFTYVGLDGSRTAIRKAEERFREDALAGEFVIGTFDAMPWPDNTFDSVIDIASLQCNAEEGTRTILKEVHRILKPGGKHFSLTAKNDSWGDGTGVRIDATSYRDIQDGPYVGMGVIRFATRESLKKLYADFNDLELEYSIRSVNQCTREVSNWVVICRK